MARDFLGKQIKTTKIIGSGLDSSAEPKLIVYRDTKSTDSIGGIDPTLLNNVGNEVFLYVDGDICGKSNNIPKSTVVFGGDVEIRGYLYNDRTDDTLWEVDPQFSDCLIPTNILDGETGLFALDFNEFTDVDGANISSQYTMTSRRNASDKYFEFDADGNVTPRDLDADALQCLTS